MGSADGGTEEATKPTVTGFFLSPDNLPWLAFGNAPTVSADRTKPRLLAKDGTLLVSAVGSHLYRNRVINWFHIALEDRWRRIFFVFGGGLILSWVLFAGIYLLIAYVAGDLNEQPQNPDHEACILNVNSFISALLYSVETQETVGYGYRYITGQCAPAYITMFVQAVFGVLLQNGLCAIIIAKIMRPKKRTRELRFSKTATITTLSAVAASMGPEDAAHLLADGVDGAQLALVFRVADTEQRLHSPEPHVRLYMCKTRVNRAGHRELLYTRDMDVGFGQGADRMLLIWPVMVVHVIDQRSPLFGITAESLAAADDFELVPIVEGVVEATGRTYQARSSYLPSEIQWGRRFPTITRLDQESKLFSIQYAFFDHTIKADVDELNASAPCEDDSAKKPPSISGFY